ncbi:MAG: hypothetical protein OHK0011_05630 [Turneriella sp.]
MKFFTVLLVTACFSGGLFAESRSNLFHIKRNKNRNEVHYAVRYDEKTCKPVENEPLYGYWAMLEKGSNVFEPIGRLERMAYGIQSQEIRGNDLIVQLKAFPDRAIRIAFNAAGGCKITPFLPINGEEAILKFISVFAEEGLIKPTVKYVDISGIKGGSAVSERINK